MVRWLAGFPAVLVAIARGLFPGPLRYLAAFPRVLCSAAARFSTTLLFLVGVALPSFGYSETLFDVVRHAFCREISNHEPARIFENPANLRANERVLFWVEIKVNDLGYRYLRRFGRLPVNVAWGYGGLITGKPVDIGITQRKWEQERQAISWKVQSSDDGSFTWRTFVERPRPLPPGTYYVSLIDPNRKAVPVRGADSLPRPELTFSEVAN